MRARRPHPQRRPGGRLAGQLEQAEHYWEQLLGFGLTMAPLTQSG